MRDELRYIIGLSYMGFMSVLWMLGFLGSFLWPIWGPAVGWQYESSTVTWWAIVSCLLFVASTGGFLTLLLDDSFSKKKSE